MGLFDDDGDDLALMAVQEVKKMKKGVERLFSDFNEVKDTVSDLEAGFEDLRLLVTKMSGIVETLADQSGGTNIQMNQGGSVSGGQG